MGDEVQIGLTQEEAWVLFEFVRRFSDTDQLSVEDQAEARALWNLCCVFEKTLHHTGDDDYYEFIEKCRGKLRDQE